MTDAAPGTPAASIPRRHDLDALRAVAMLLGIVLHGAMSFIPGLWVVQDRHAGGDWAGILLTSLHGFRMPLFFLISGFFTAMLLRKRGLRALVAHRLKRILLPLAIGMVTIIPAVWAVTIYAATASADERPASAPVAASPDAKALNDALIAAAVFGNADEIRSLLEGGADTQARDERGTTALHLAALFGYPEIAEVLLDAGADPEAKNNEGRTPGELLYTPLSITRFIADLVGTEVDWDALHDSRREIADMLGMPDDPALAEALGGKGGADGMMAAAAGNALLGFLFLFPMLHHLWFLWFLCWLVAGYVLIVKFARVLGIGGLPRWMTVSVARYFWLVPLTAILQGTMQGFGPDTSIGLLPLPNVLLYYALFFGYGAMYFDADDRDGVVGRLWWIALPLGLFVAYPAGLATLEAGEGGRMPGAVAGAAYAWLLSFGLLGLFRTVLQTESRAMRYLSDSSYWLYVAHLPLIMLVQYWVRDTDWPVAFKFVVICGSTTLVLVVSYQAFVRYTIIGTLLNGPRIRAGRNAEPVPVPVEHRSS